MAKLLSGTRIYGTATVDTQLFVSGTTESSSTITGALQIVGGLGVGRGAFFGGVVTATSFVGAVLGVASSATNLVGGSTGAIVYQSNTNTTAFLSLSTAGYVLIAGASGPQWTKILPVTNGGTGVETITGVVYGNGTSAFTTATGVQISTALGSTNIAGFAANVTGIVATNNGGTGISSWTAGDIAYYSSGTALTKIGIGSTNYILGSDGAKPLWISPSGVSAGSASTASNLAGGTAGQVPYQTAAGLTSFYGPGTAGQILLSSGTNAPVYTSTGSIYVGRAVLADTATTATNIAGGTSGQLAYQTAPGLTSFAGPGTAGDLLISNGTGAPTYNNTLTLTSITSATSTSTGALQVRGGVGIGGSVYAGSIYDSNNRVVTSVIPTGSTYIGVTDIVSTGTQTSFTISNLGVQTLTAGTDTAVSSNTGTITVWNTSTLQSVTNRGATTTNAISINNTTSSTSTNSGALVVSGGVGINQDVNIGGNLTVLGTVNATIVGSVTTATNLAGGTSGQVPYQTAPGITSFYGPGTAGNILVSNGTGAPTYNNTLTLTSTNASTSTTTGALQVAGGVGIGGTLFVNNTATIISTVTATSTTTGALQVLGGVGVRDSVYIGNKLYITAPGGVNPNFVMQGDDEQTFRFYNSNATTGTTTRVSWKMASRNNSDWVWIMYTDTIANGTDDWVLQNRSGAVIYASTASNIGIGTTSPTTKLDVAGGARITGITTVTNVAVSSSTATGALQVIGGIGAGGAVYSGGVVASQGASYQTSLSSTGSGPMIQFGSPATPNLYMTLGAYSGANNLDSNTRDFNISFSTGFGANAVAINATTGVVTLASTAAATSTATGALRVLGGVGIGGALYASGSIYSSATIYSNNLLLQGNNSNAYVRPINAGSFLYLGAANTNYLSIGPSGVVTVLATTASTSTATGALQVAGGLGVGGDIYANTFNTLNDTAGTVLATFGGSSLVNRWIRIRNDASAGVEFGQRDGTFTLPGASLGGGVALLKAGNNKGFAINVNDGTGFATIANAAFWIDNTGVTKVTSTASAISTASGAFQVAGGVGIGGDLYVGGEIIAQKLTIQLTTITTTQVTTDDIISTYNSTNATNTASGALQITGGAGIGRDLYVGGTIFGTFSGTVAGTVSTASNIAGGTAGQLVYQSAPNVTSFAGPGTAGNVLVSNGTGAPTYNNTLTLTSTNASTSTTTGALVVTGGVGIGRDLYVGTSATISTNSGGPGTGLRINKVDLFAFSASGSNAGEPTFRTSISSATTVFRVMPNNTATNGIGAQFEFFASDYFTTPSGWHNFRIVASTSSFIIDTAKDLVGDQPRPIIFNLGGQGVATNTATYANVLTLTTSGVGINTLTPGAQFGVEGTVRIAGTATITTTTSAVSTTTGALIVTGGVGIGRDLYVGNTGTFGISSSSYITVSGANSGSGPTIASQGSDSNIDLNLTTKGTSGVRFNVGNGSKYTYLSSDSANNFQLVGAANTANLGIYATGGGSIRFYTAAGLLEEQLRITQTASAVNFIQVTGAATGGNPAISAQGSDASVNLSISSKSTGSIFLNAGGTNRVQIDPFGGVNLAVSFSGGVGFKALAVGNQVNFLQAAGSVTGSSPILSVQGTDSNVDLTLTSKGTGVVVATGGVLQAGITGNNGNLYLGGPNVSLRSAYSANVVGIYTNNAEQVRIGDVASAVNYLMLTGGTTGSGVAVSAQGSDTNIDLLYSSKGTSGTHVFRTNNTVRQFQINHITSAVNYGVVNGSITGSAPTFSVAGSDTNIDLNLTAKGSGKVLVTTSNTATSTATGALVVYGGVGINRDLYVGGTIFGTFSGTVAGTVSTASNIAGGGPGMVPYQSNTNVTAFVATGTAGTILVSNGTSAPSWNNTLSLAGTTASTSTTTGALTVAGGVGIGDSLYIGGRLGIKNTAINAGIDSVAGWAYDSTFSVTNPVDIYFKPDGLVMYLAFGTSITQYNLSVAWNITTAVAGTSFSMSLIDTVTQGLFISPDGTKMVTCGQTGVVIANGSDVASQDRAYYFTLGTPWDVSSATLVSSIRFALGDAGGIPAAMTAPCAVDFNNDGTIMYIVDATTDAVHQFALSSAYNVGTATWTKQFSVVGQESSGQGLRFNASGTRMYVVGATGDDVNEYRLSTAWDIATAVFYDKFYVGWYEANAIGMYINESANVAFVCGSSNDVVLKFRTDRQSIEIDPETSTSKIELAGNTRVADNFYVNGRTVLEGQVNTVGDLVVGGDLTISGNDLLVGSATAAATLFSGMTTGALSIATSQTTGAITVGGSGSTTNGAINIGLSTGTGQAINLATGANISGTTKLVNIATNGASGSTSIVNIGSSATGALGLLNIYSTSTVMLSTQASNSTNTGALQVIGGVGIGNSIFVNNTATIGANSSGALYVGTTGGDYGRTLVGSFRRDQNGITDFAVVNATAGASASVRISKIGGTASNFVDWLLSDNSGASFDSFNYGSAVQFLRITYNGSEQARFTFVSTAANYLSFSAGTAGNATIITATGSDTNVFAQYRTKGTGAHDFYTNSNLQFRVADSGGTSTNYVQVYGNVSGSRPIIGPQGSDTNIGLNIETKGTGALFFKTGGSSIAQLTVANVNSSVNYLQVAGAITGSAPTITVLSTADTNVDLNLTARGSGKVLVTTSNTATSTATGALVVYGGVGINRDLFVGNTATILSTAFSTSTVEHNALYVAGGVGIGRSLFVTGPAIFNNSVVFAGTSTYVYSTNTVYTDNLINLHVPVGSTGTNHDWLVDDGQDIGLVFHYYKGTDRNAFLGFDNTTTSLEWYSNGNEVGNVFTGTEWGVFRTGAIVLNSLTNATTTATGALQVLGGVGIGKDVWIGGNLNVAGTINATISGVITTATNVGGGTAGQVPYQTGVGATSFYGPGTAGQILLSSGTNAPVYTNTASIHVGRSTLAETVVSVNQSTPANYFPVFVDSNNATAAGEQLYTTSSIVINPTGGGQLGLGTTPVSSSALTISRTYNTATAAESFPFYISGQYSIADTSLKQVIRTNYSGQHTTGTQAFGVNILALASVGGVGGVTTNLYNYWSRIDNSTNATVTNAFHYFISDGGASGGPVNQYGYYADPLTKGTQNFAFYAAGTTKSYFGGDVGIGTTAPTAKLDVSGGVRISGVTTVTNTTTATSTTTGALQVSGGVGVGGLLWLGQNTTSGIRTTNGFIYDDGNLHIHGLTGALWLNSTAVGGDIRLNNQYNGNVILTNGVGNVQIVSTQSATSTTTGALQVVGGVGIGGNLYVGNIITANNGIIRPNERSMFNRMANGLVWRRYSHAIPAYPAAPDDFTTFIKNSSTFVSQGITANINNFTFSADNYITEFAGYIYAATTGTYAFGVNSDDASDLFIDDTLVAHWYGIHGAGGGSLPGGTTSTVVLQKGYHRLYTRFFEVTGGDSHQILYIPPTTTTWTVIESANLYINPSDFLRSNGTTLDINSTATISNTTVASSTATGALVVTGGVGIGGDLRVGGTIFGAFAGTVSGTSTNASNIATIAVNTNSSYFPTFVDSNNASTGFEALYTTSSFSINPTTGAVTIGGGFGAARLSLGALVSNRVLSIYDDNTNWYGLGIAGSEFRNLAPQNWTVGTYTRSSDTYTERMRVDSNGNVGIGIASASSLLHVAGTARITGVTTVTNVTNASSTITGALQVLGGVGIGGNIYVGGSIYELTSGTAYQVVSQADIGSAPNQIPLNQYLGKLAFQDYISGGTF